MGLRKKDLLKFSELEKKEIEDALNNVLDDIVALWDTASDEYFFHYFKTNDSAKLTDSLLFEINDDGIIIKNSHKDIYLEQFKKHKKRPKVKDYVEIYYFIRQYNEIRQLLEEQIIATNQAKNKGIEEVIAIKNQYAKEATIELDLPETINPHSIEVRKEDGKTIGEVKMGYGALKIITRGPITLTQSEIELEKVKHK